MDDEQLMAMARAAEGAFARRKRTIEDFRYDEQQEKYWDTTTGNLLGARSVDGAIHPEDWPQKEDKRNGKPRAVRPSLAINNIDTGLTVEGSTWWPGQPRFIENVVVSERGAMYLKGAVCYNSYIPPDLRGVKEASGDAGPWTEHVKRLYPDPAEHEHFFDYCAHAVQRPEEKVNHGLVMAGAQGIGKDTALLPIRRGVGEWNAAEIGPEAVTGQYNGYIKSVLLVVNEVRPHDAEFKASNFYNMLKPILAAPPEMLPMTLKYANTIYIRNLAHVVLTTNDPLTMYIPPEDRRLFVMSSALPDPKTSDVFAPDYFDRLYHWLNSGGIESVVKWLLERQSFEFNSAAPPPMTKGKRAIIESAHQVRRTLVDEVLEQYSEAIFGGVWPTVIFHRDLTQFVRETEYFDDETQIIKQLNAKNFHFKMAERGYDMFRNPEASEWKRDKFRTRIAFCSREVPHDQQLERIKDELTRRPLEMSR